MLLFYFQSMPQAKAKTAPTQKQPPHIAGDNTTLAHNNIGVVVPKSFLPQLSFDIFLNFGRDLLYLVFCD